eukprot:CAMPEP_0113313190 /NCGR_PEP_ID=MMETSP0010_2-20120614/9709_1 /TAXON_ID=216773 ORGANISM="Corethron hystrix, Strain 308" /NCGR_SAMPLE_ID=MMETSP0010_2 /ASSEMBLY_ACC=CAM_ASM_000155 /LENGTH=429 /DNA_ID=CAMNT_0000169145 /DNA_START=393 /DNA_END=1682 /DNA_ORIENTATION=+ /assembly_acc=CAM_ASM_000155
MRSSIIMVPKANPVEMDDDYSAPCSYSCLAKNLEDTVVGSYIRDPAAASSFRNTFSRMECRKDQGMLAMSLPNHAQGEMFEGMLASSFAPKAPSLRGRVGGVKCSMQEKSLSTSFRHALSNEINFESLYAQRQQKDEEGHEMAGSSSQPSPIHLPQSVHGDDAPFAPSSLSSSLRNYNCPSLMTTYSSRNTKCSNIHEAQSKTVGATASHKGGGIGGVLKNDPLTAISEMNSRNDAYACESSVSELDEGNASVDSLSKSLTALEMMERSKQVVGSTESQNTVTSKYDEFGLKARSESYPDRPRPRSAASVLSLYDPSSPSSILNDKEQNAIIGSLTRTAEWTIAAHSTSPHNPFSPKKTSRLPNHELGNRQEERHTHMYIDSDYSLDPSNDFLEQNSTPEPAITHCYFVEDASSESPCPDTLETFDMDF